MTDTTERDTYREPLFKRELLERAKESETPVTEVNVSDDGKTTRVDAILECDGTAWLATIDHYTDTDGQPRVCFEKSHHGSEEKFLRRWRGIAVGYATDPQDLPTWESIFTAFNAALGEYNRAVRGDYRSRFSDTAEGGDA